MTSYLRAVCRFEGPKKEVLSLRAFFKNCPLWSAGSINPRQLCKKTMRRLLLSIRKIKYVYKDIVKSLCFGLTPRCCDLHPVLRCRDGPLRGLLASADELWGDTSGPGRSPLQQTHTHSRGPAYNNKMRISTPYTHNTVHKNPLEK